MSDRWAESARKLAAIEDNFCLIIFRASLIITPGATLIEMGRKYEYDARIVQEHLDMVEREIARRTEKEAKP